MARKAKKATDTATETTAPTTNIEQIIPIRGVTVAHAPLRAALLAMQTIVDRKSTMPMLSHVAVRATDGTLTLVGTDLNVSLTVMIACDTLRPGGVCLPAKKLHDVARTFDGDTTTFDMDGANATVRNGRVKAALIGLHERDFPKVPNADDDTLSWGRYQASEIVEMLDSVLFSVCKDETRFHLNGVFVETEGQTMRMVTTDGHRLTKIARPIAHPNTALAAGKIIPCKGATEIARILRTSSNEECSIAFGRDHVFVRSGDVVLSAKYIDAQFPAYRQVIPSLPSRLATIAVDPLMSALKRAKLLGSDTRGVKFELTPGTLTLTSDDPDAGTVSETVDADYIGERAVIGFNPQYLMEALSKLACDRISLAIRPGKESKHNEDGASLDPALVRSSDDACMNALDDSTMICVIMPMRV